MVYNRDPALLGFTTKDHALVAQLDRVLASEAKGRGFDSRRARHTLKARKCGLFVGKTSGIITLLF
jgi:hypothetical protein